MIKTINRAVATCLLLSLLSIGLLSDSWALGLGEARVDSYLSQPLDVRVRLIEASEADLDTLQVNPAGPADYDRLGIPSTALGLDLQVSVDRRVSPPEVRIRSRRPVTDPIVQVLLDARWANGRMLREYTLFLDPATLDLAPPVRRVAEPPARPAPTPAPAEPAPAPTPVEPAPRPAPAPTPAPTPAPAPAEPTPPAAPEPAPRPAVTDQYGPVAAGETLWAIARNVRPDATLTMNQVMIAILERNPEAFVGGNVNQLLRGAELTIPGLAEMRAVNPAAAEEMIRAQMQTWQQQVARRDVPTVTEVAVPEEPARPTPPPEVEPEPEPEVTHRLALVPPLDEEVGEGVELQRQEEAERLRESLTRVEDEMFAADIDDDRLWRQLDELRRAVEVEDLTGLSMVDEDLALLQDRLREARREREELAAALEATPEPDEDEVAAYLRELERELAEREPEVIEDPVVEAVEPEVAAPVEAAPEPIPHAFAPEPRRGFFGSLLFYIVLAVVALILLAAAWFILNRRSQESAAAPAGSKSSALSPVDQARAELGRDPRDLSRHLALLSALAAVDRSEEFADALDDMYRHVDNENAEEWQQALDLAVTHAPDHPMLTPNETALGDDDLDDDILSVLERDEADSEEETSTVSPFEEADESDADDDDLSLFGPDDEEDGADRDRLSATEDDSAEDALDAGDDPGSDEEVDLAEFSSRLDDAAEDEPIPDEDEDDPFSLEEFTDEQQQDRTEVLSVDDLEGSEDGDEPEPLTIDEEDDELDLERFLAEEMEDDADQHAAVDEAGPDETDEDALDLELDDEALDLGLEDESEDFEPSDEALSADQPDGAMALEDEDLDLGSFDLADVPEAEEDSPLADDSADEGEGDDLAELDEVGDDSAVADALDLDDVDDAPVDVDAGEINEDDAEVKLDLARAYLSMDDNEAARAILEEVLNEGSAEQREQARQLLDGIG